LLQFCWAARRIGEGQQTNAGAGRQRRAQVQSRSILAEAVAQPLEHAAGDRLYVEEKNDHVWFLNRAAAADGDEIAGRQSAADSLLHSGTRVVELDPAGNVVQAWGGPGYIPEWPTALQTVIADRAGNVWVAGTGPQDSILKFTRNGKLLWDFGHRPPKDMPYKENNQNTDVFGVEGRFNLTRCARDLTDH